MSRPVRSTARFYILLMRTNKKQNKSAIRRPEVRSIKIQPRYRFQVNESKMVPEIKLCGEWLKKLGFELGQRVVITTMNELLIIRVQREDELAGQL